MMHSGRSRIGILRPAFLRTAFVTVLLSLLGGGLMYSAWLALFLLFFEKVNPILRTLLWVSAPVTTAIGFALGIALSDRLTKKRPSSFLSIIGWPFIGCAAGAAIVYWFGPMLIVFGMFLLGTASVAVREVTQSLRSNSNA